MSNYWEERAAKNAFKKADQFNKQLMKVYKQAFKSIDAQLKDVWLEILKDGEINQAAIYKNNRLKRLMGLVDKQLQQLGAFTDNNMQLNLLDVYRSSYTDATSQLTTVTTSFSLLQEQIAKEVVNASFKNATYSTRVFENLRSIRAQIEKAVVDTTITGKDYKKASKALADRMSVSLSDAKRIVVTETARVHSEATRNAAIDRGYNSYHILLESDACEDCQELRDRHFSLSRNDILPAHPHCRCCMVIDLEEIQEVE